jgi:hypothetical protein
VVTFSAERRRTKVIERQNRGYAGLLAETVEDDQWVSQFDAADILGISLMRVGALIQGGRLKPVHNTPRQAGVSLQTVERERQRRADAGALRRAWLFAADVARSLLRGL